MVARGLLDHEQDFIDSLHVMEVRQRLENAQETCSLLRLCRAAIVAYVPPYRRTANVSPQASMA
jgi:hypothetical protein